MAMSPRYVQYLYAQNDLLERIVRFNHEFKGNFAAKKEAHINANDGSLATVHPKLAEFRDIHGLSFDFTEEIDRFCLINNDELDVLSLYLGACIVSIGLNNLQGFDYDDAIKQIGKSAFDFALQNGYTIQNLNFKLNINALHQDCTYLGLCALKRLTTLFSTLELSNYFENRLVQYTLLRGLDPEIVRAQSHVLNIDTQDNVPIYSPQAIKEDENLYPQDKENTKPQVQFDYAKGALSGAFNYQQRRFFRASVHRQMLNQGLSPQITPKHKSHETLINLNFSPANVKDLAIKILTEAISSNWRDYLSKEVNFTRED